MEKKLQSSVSSINLHPLVKSDIPITCFFSGEEGVTENNKAQVISLL